MIRKSSRASGDAGRETSYTKIYRAVLRIPRGRVATYGQIAVLAGVPRQARLVGYALHALREGSGVPWHRVVNAKGRISARSGDEVPMHVVQRRRLERERVRFDVRGRIPLGRYQWGRR
ncbi:MAG: MGMT family protein [Acidobacteria bacterium]|nr:MGMT family protein [Acidobacteriota bacterium]MCA1612415.1 MGMT family protein [Acidobacteriota bacterium]